MGIAQPLVDQGSGPPPHMMSVAPQVTGQVAGHGDSGSDGMHVAGISHPLASIPPLHTMSFIPQFTGQCAGQAAAGSFGIQYMGIMHPSVDQGSGPPPHMMSVAPQVTGQVAGHDDSGSDGMHVAGISHPLASIPPLHHISLIPQVTGQCAGQSAAGSFGIQYMGIGQPSEDQGSGSPPQRRSAPWHSTGATAGHSPATSGRRRAATKSFMLKIEMDLLYWNSIP